MSTRESLKRELIDEINRRLARDNAQMTPIVQDAARLSLIGQDHYYYMITTCYFGLILMVVSQKETSWLRHSKMRLFERKC
jgi:hypothetical protein